MGPPPTAGQKQAPAGVVPHFAQAKVAMQQGNIGAPTEIRSLFPSITPINSQG